MHLYEYSLRLGFGCWVGFMFCFGVRNGGTRPISVGLRESDLQVNGSFPKLGDPNIDPNIL